MHENLEYVVFEVFLITWCIGQVVCLLFVFTIFQNYCHSLDTPGRLLNDTLESGENTVRLNQEECSESTQKQVQKHCQIAENQFILFLALLVIVS